MGRNAKKCDALIKSMSLKHDFSKTQFRMVKGAASSELTSSHEFRNHKEHQACHNLWKSLCTSSIMPDAMLPDEEKHTTYDCVPSALSTMPAPDAPPNSLSKSMQAAMKLYISYDDIHRATIYLTFVLMPN